jgi:hypothetical protein
MGVLAWCCDEHIRVISAGSTATVANELKGSSTTKQTAKMNKERVKLHFMIHSVSPLQLLSPSGSPLLSSALLSFLLSLIM